MPTMIEITNLNKYFGRHAVLNGINLVIEQGEFVALIGPNGAGKTTLLRLLGTICTPTSGRIILSGLSLPARAVEARRLIGMVASQPLLYADLTARENLLFYCRLYGVEDAKTLCECMLAQVGLTGQADEPVRVLSSGMQQRLAIGRALVHNPSLLLLDEPFNGLDQDAGQMLTDLLHTLQNEGKTILLASHDLSGMGSLASRFIILDRGEVKADLQQSALPQGGLLNAYRTALSQVQPKGETA